REDDDERYDAARYFCFCDAIEIQSLLQYCIGYDRERADWKHECSNAQHLHQARHLEPNGDRRRRHEDESVDHAGDREGNIEAKVELALLKVRKLDDRGAKPQIA